ncbi:carbamate kinase [Pseudonocardia sp. TRM90224]|uniref:carbamate kinase n=1 Tax=Pseudonocardia sp. TRM90224 TaxID=2812678 RepID=UPI001E556FD8|nr:carbamate kinase [Pseudonocardia sp. TRM90224]
MTATMGAQVRTAVVALGGNAITRAGQAGTSDEQLANARGMADAVCELHAAGWRVVLVHGNGPQVGNLAIQQDEAAHRVPRMPMYLLDAMTEGQLGSVVTLALHEAGGGQLPGIVTVITHVVVDESDPAFARPTKPVGPFMSADEAKQRSDELGWVVAEDAGRGYRRLVPSPQPREIVELEAVTALVERGQIVIAAGGGGVPVVVDGGAYRGVDAVIDKDIAAQRLATALGAEALVLVTDVARVALDHGTEHERPIEVMSVDEAQAHADDGQFPEGSMGPKVRAAIQFLRAGGRTAVITNAALAGTSLGPSGTGTRIVAAPRPLDARIGA